jgi:radical SAM protein with 4Fe4S-binding SPASM domain
MKSASFFASDSVRTFLVRAHNQVFHGRWDMPETISIELSQACNRHCVYCPQSLAPKKQQIVSQELWKMFLNRLDEIKWRGIVTFHLFNEPTIVPKFPEYVRELKARRPKCLPYLFTNGDRPAVIEEALQAGLFMATITEHPPFKEGWAEPVEKLKKKWGMHVRIQRIAQSSEDVPSDFKGEIIDMHNQAGRFDLAEPITKCIHEAGALTIDFEGNMLLCCRDYDHEYKFGNIMDGSIKDLWYSPKAVKTRQLVAKGISATKLCNGCFQPYREEKKASTEAVATT